MLTATWTSATPINTALTLAVAGQAQAYVFLAPDQAGTPGAIALETSSDGGGTWAPDLTFDLDGAQEIFYRPIGPSVTHYRVRVAVAIVGPCSLRVRLTSLISVSQPPQFSSIMIPTVSAASTIHGVIVSSSAVLVQALNSDRKSIIIVNNGSSGIYIGKDNTVTTSGATMGIKLMPNGSYSDSGDGLYTGNIWAIGDASSVVHNISCWERF